MCRLWQFTWCRPFGRRSEARVVEGHKRFGPGMLDFFDPRFDVLEVLQRTGVVFRHFFVVFGF